jgi:hypothetical protein
MHSERFSIGAMRLTATSALSDYGKVIPCDGVENRNWDNPCMEKAMVKITLKDDIVGKIGMDYVFFCKKHYKEFKHQTFVFR